MLTSRVRRGGRRLIVIVGIGAALAVAFNLTTVERSLDAAAQGVIDGALIALAIGGYGIFVRDGLLRERYRRLTFVWSVVLDTAIVLPLFLVARAFGLLLTSGEPQVFFASFRHSDLLISTPFVAVVVVVMNFVTQMNRMVGTNVLRYFMTGVYHQPLEEERLFLFLDLVGSTRLAERLGSSNYYELLRRFVDDLTEPILATRGEIYQYAGDEVVITWRMADGLHDANCLRCFFAIEDAVEARSERYESEFGEIPRFRAGLHGGLVIAGELGDLKREIVFVGDILNTTARLVEYARSRELAFVASSAVVDPLELPAEITAEFECEITPRGKDQQIRIHRIERAMRRK